MERISSVLCRLRRRAIPLLFVAVALTVSGCGDEGKNGSGSAGQSVAGESCQNVLSAQGEAAVRRLGGVSESAKISGHGSPRSSVEKLVNRYDAGLTEAQASKRVDFCGYYIGPSVVMPAVQVRFSFEGEMLDLGTDSVVRKYRMAESAYAANRMGSIYFECSSDRFAVGAGATVLVHGESRSLGEPAEAGVAARRDNLRIIYESSRVFSELLGCKSNAGLPSTFMMPPEVKPGMGVETES